MSSLLLKNVIFNNSPCDIAVSGTKIVSVEPAGTQTEAEKVIDGGGHLAVTLPFYNTHTHAAMTLLRGYADDKELFDWLNNYIWPAEAKMNADDIFIGTSLAILEMIHSGCCYFNDMYWFQEAAIRAVEKFGIRADIGLLHLTLPSDSTEAAAKRAENERLIGLEPTLSKKIRIAYAPHAIYSVSGADLRELAEKSECSKRPLHIHCSETAQEVADCRKAHDNMTPVEYLDSLGFLTPRTLLAHCTFLTGHDRELIAARGSFIGHCPISNAKLCSGRFDLPSAQQSNCHITIATDGASSNNNLSMLEEMKFAAIIAKRSSGKTTDGKDSDILRYATLEGAHYAGVDAGIAPGKEADLLLVELDSPQMVGDYSLDANLVYSADSSVCHTLICGGQVVMEDHQIPGEAEIIAVARKACNKFRK